MAKFSVRGNSAEDRANVISYLSSLGDKEYIIEIKAVSKVRSIAENSYYWGVVVKTLADELGYFHDEMHEILKMKFDAVCDTLPNGDMVIYPGSTKEYDVARFEDRLEKIRIWALSDLNIKIPLPNELTDKEEAI